MKVSIRTIIFPPSENVAPGYHWGLVVKAGGKHNPAYELKLYSYIVGYKTKKAAVKAMRAADQAVRFQFRKDVGQHRRHGVTVSARYLRNWWQKWSEKQAGFG